MSTNMPEVADLHSWFQPMTKLEIVDAVDNGKSRARDCLHALSLAEANYDNMRYYGDLIVFFKIYFVQKGIIISILYRYSLEGNGLDYQKVQAHLKKT